MPAPGEIPMNRYYGRPRNARRRDATAKYGWGEGDGPKGGVVPTGIAPDVRRKDTVSECHTVEIFYVERGTKGTVRLKIPVGSCNPDSDVLIEVGSSDPHIHVLCASYGHPYDVSKVIDLKDKMLRRIKRTREGYMLDVTTTDDLDKEFGTPVDDVYKVLFMRYKVLPEKGVHDVVLRRNGPLGVSARVGFAPKGEVLESGGKA